MDLFGSPLEGEHTVDVALYADDDPATVALWSEQQLLEFEGGYYSLQLGASASNPLLPSYFDDALFYGLSIDSGAEMPRTELTSTPFAIRAAAADALSSTATVDYNALINVPDPVDGTDFVLSDQACSAGDLVTGVDANGQLVCEPAPSSGTPAHVGAVYRWAVFGTYDQGNWMHGNDNAMFGGIHPSQWTDGNARAFQLSTDMEVLRSLFTRKGYGGTNANVYTQVFTQYSSTNGQVVVALFRIRNTTASSITWTPVFNYTCYSSWSERASVALNGVAEWESGGENCIHPSVRTEPISIPANGTSTVTFISTSGSASANTNNIWNRSVSLAFRDGSLALPNGLEYVDDLDTATSLFEN